MVNTFPSSSVDYVTPAIEELKVYLPDGVSCSQSFSYEMDDSSSNPAELTIDALTGVLSLTNNANQK